jgi:CBS-domain-containing membrane protein
VRPALHPPAGANPIVILLAGASWTFLFAPVLLGAMVIVLLAFAYRRMSQKPYPIRPS